MKSCSSQKKQIAAKNDFFLPEWSECEEWMNGVRNIFFHDSYYSGEIVPAFEMDASCIQFFGPPGILKKNITNSYLFMLMKTVSYRQ